MISFLLLLIMNYTNGEPEDSNKSVKNGSDTLQNFSDSIVKTLSEGTSGISSQSSISLTNVSLAPLLSESSSQKLDLKPVGLVQDLVSNEVDVGDKVAPMKAEKLQFCGGKCKTMQGVVGRCVSSQGCLRRGGRIEGPCCGETVCCVFQLTCGDISSEEVTHFRSPDFPRRSTGSIACDFDLLIRGDVCAVRIDFFKTLMVGKLGGICDIDQFIVINAADGPMTSHCGDLTGYSTTVAVASSQKKPLKVVAIMQNEAHFLWDLRLKQIKCSDVRHFKKPPICGSKDRLEPSYTFYNFLNMWKNLDWHSMNPGDFVQEVWWNFPSPVFNKYYYDTTRRVLKRGPVPPSSLVAEDRVIHGADAEPHQFPWQVAVVLQQTFFCGGALINEVFVLSAAHCFLTRDTPVSDLSIYLGDHDLTTSNETLHTVRGVRRIHFHSHFHSMLLSNDIAMLMMDRAVAFSHSIRPVCLPYPVNSEWSISVTYPTDIEKKRTESNQLNQPSTTLIKFEVSSGNVNLTVWKTVKFREYHTGEDATVTGWGITSFPDGKPSPVLQRLEVEIISNEKCAEIIEEELGAGNLCAVPRGLQGTCFGDSGGPLTIDNEGRETLIGIISFGVTGCAVVPGFPDLYTRVSEYLRWIDISALLID